jgi:hypothetical protein
MPKKNRFWTLAMVAETKLYYRKYPNLALDKAVSFLHALEVMHLPPLSQLAAPSQHGQLQDHRWVWPKKLFKGHRILSLDWVEALLHGIHPGPFLIILCFMQMYHQMWNTIIKLVVHEQLLVLSKTIMLLRLHIRHFLSSWVGLLLVELRTPRTECLVGIVVLSFNILLISPLSGLKRNTLNRSIKQLVCITCMLV